MSIAVSCLCKNTIFYTVILFRLKTAEHPENCLNKKLSRHLVQVRSFDECFGIGVLRGSKYVQAVALFDHFAIF